MSSICNCEQSIEITYYLWTSQFCYDFNKILMIIYFFVKRETAGGNINEELGEGGCLEIFNE